MENSFLASQLITYIGNKRSLLDFIDSAISLVKEQTGLEKLRICDLFSGSSVVARYFKAHASHLAVNDLENYCRVINTCYLANKSQLDMGSLESIYAELLAKLGDDKLRGGFISQLYAPADDSDIQPGERAFFTTRNANYIDTARQEIALLPADVQPFFIAPLLAEASVKNNTAGVFKGFYKNSATGVGQFGGTGGNALARICAPIKLPFPIFSRHECPVEIFQRDAALLAPDLQGYDLVYIDPPYNQHPYGSNYFMLNLICDYEKPKEISQVSGIPKAWNRSDYNKSKQALSALSHLCRHIDSRYLLISFNSEGFISKPQMENMLSGLGEVTVFAQKYNTFRGSRNLANRPTYLQEFLFLVKKS